MALSVLGLALQPGLESAETGINASSINVEYKPEFVRKTKNYQDQTVGRILPTLASREITIEAEAIVGSSTGLTTATFLADCASLITNDKAEYGSPAGLVMLDSVTVGQERGSERKNSYKFSSDPLFTSV